MVFLFTQGARAVQSGHSGVHRADDGQLVRVSDVDVAEGVLGQLAHLGDLVILESTVPPHTSEMLARVLSEESGIPMEKIHVAHCPERVIPSKPASARVIAVGRPI